MGLTIHYKLTHKKVNESHDGQILSDIAQLEAASKVVEKLRQKCLGLPFKEVSKLHVRTGEDCDWSKLKNDDPLRWVLIQVTHYIRAVRIDGRYKQIDEDTPHNNGVETHFGIAPVQAVLFTAWPGPGCEESNFGLCKYPETEVVTSESGHKTTLVVPGPRWKWGTFCKTQYANDPKAGGMPNFLRCHLTVVAALDAAKRLGFKVDVKDEGHYWKKRDIPALSQEIGEWDTMIAGWAGALKDAFGDTVGGDGMTVKSSMDGRVDFEKLEAAAKVNPKLADLIKVIQATVRKSKVKEKV